MATARSDTGFYITQRSRRYSPRNGTPPSAQAPAWPCPATRARHTSGARPAHLRHPPGPGARAAQTATRAATGTGASPAYGVTPQVAKPPQGIAGSQRPGPRRPAPQAQGDRGSGGIPPEKHCEPRRSRPKADEDRATPGGYGGKPPGVAFIGVPTGARNAGRCSDGGPEHRMYVTPKPPLARQDEITGPRAGVVFSNRGTGTAGTGCNRLSRG